MRRKGRESKYFSALADEAVDISNKDHLSVVSRFVDSEKNTREKSVGFYLCEGGTAGVAIKELILQAKHLRSLFYKPDDLVELHHSWEMRVWTIVLISVGWFLLLSTSNSAKVWYVSSSLM